MPLYKGCQALLNNKLSIVTKVLVDNAPYISQIISQYTCGLSLLLILILSFTSDMGNNELIQELIMYTLLTLGNNFGVCHR